MKKSIFLAAVVVLSLVSILFTACGKSKSNPAAAATCATLGVKTDIDNNYVTPGYFTATSITASSDMSISCIYAKAQPASNSMAVAIYSDSANAPGTLLAGSAITAVSGGWTRFSFGAAALSSGNKYWLVAIGQAYGIRISDGASYKYYYYPWATFSSTGFPADASGLNWLDSTGSIQNIYVSSCN
jgi:hypothetical protein